MGHAQTAALLSNIYRSKGAKPVTAADFMPRLEPKKSQSADDMKMIAAMWTAAYDPNAEDL